MYKVLGLIPSTEKKKEPSTGVGGGGWGWGGGRNASNPSTQKLRKKNCEFEANLYYIVRPCLKKNRRGKGRPLLPD
jgi:hypothetical protein